MTIVSGGHVAGDGKKGSVTCGVGASVQGRNC